MQIVTRTFHRNIHVVLMRFFSSFCSDESSFASVKLPSKSKCKELKLLSKVGNETAEKKSAST